MVSLGFKGFVLSTAALGRLLKKKNIMTQGIINLCVRNSACMERGRYDMHPEGTGLACPSYLCSCSILHSYFTLLDYVKIFIVGAILALVPFMILVGVIIVCCRFYRSYRYIN